MNRIITYFRNESNYHSLFSEIVKANYELILSVDKKQFTEKFTLTKCDAVILDVSDFNSSPEIEWIIQFVRVVHKSKVPIIILANNISKQQTNHLLELGIDDVLNYPVDKQFLYKRLSEKISGVAVDSLSLNKLNLKNEDIVLRLNFKLKSISEDGFEIEAPAFIARGTRIRISSKLIRNIFGVDTVEVTVNSFIGDNNGQYLNLCQLDPSNKDFGYLLKKWLVESLHLADDHGEKVGNKS